MNRIDRIRQQLASLKPTSLEIIDESPQHAGHMEDSAAKETHLKIIITAQSLMGRSRVAQHKIINELVAGEFDSGLHALTIKIQ